MQDVVGSTSMQRNEGQNHCIDGSNLGDLIRTLGVRDDGGHGSEGPGGHAEGKEG